MTLPVAPNVRRYVLASTDEERTRLVASLCEMTGEYFGYPAREANVAHWRAMPITELRRVHGNWRTLLAKYSRSIAENLTDKGFELFL